MDAASNNSKRAESFTGCVREGSLLPKQGVRCSFWGMDIRWHSVGRKRESVICNLHSTTARTHAQLLPRSPFGLLGKVAFDLSSPQPVSVPIRPFAPASLSSNSFGLFVAPAPPKGDRIHYDSLALSASRIFVLPLLVVFCYADKISPDSCTSSAMLSEESTPLHARTCPPSSSWLDAGCLHHGLCLSPVLSRWLSSAIYSAHRKPADASFMSTLFFSNLPPRLHSRALFSFVFLPCSALQRTFPRPALSGEQGDFLFEDEESGTSIRHLCT